ncbi:hypothetical protein ACFX1Z_029780 [Malus domestica]
MAHVNGLVDAQIPSPANTYHPPMETLMKKISFLNNKSITIPFVCHMPKEKRKTEKRDPLVLLPGHLITIYFKLSGT